VRSIPGSAILVFTVSVLAAACADHGVPHVAPDESQPHVTWEVRTGGYAGDRIFVCGSSDPSKRCVLTASAGQRGTAVTVRLYLHAANAQTNYLGVMTTPFVDGAASEREISLTVPRGSRPVSSFLSGRVTDKPGTYTLNIGLDATRATSDNPVRIAEQHPVIVNVATATAETGLSLFLNLAERELSPF
jgi:hypothetical protein